VNGNVLMVKTKDSHIVDHRPQFNNHIHVHNFADRNGGDCIKFFLQVQCRQQVSNPNDPEGARPLSSDRQHLSYNVCLGVRGEIIRTVLFCIVYWSCAQS